jgi:hypothetical protein
MENNKNFVEIINEIEKDREGKKEVIGLIVRLKSGEIKIGRFIGCSSDHMSMYIEERQEDFYREDVVSVKPLSVSTMLFLIGKLQKSNYVIMEHAFALDVILKSLSFK